MIIASVLAVVLCIGLFIYLPSLLFTGIELLVGEAIAPFRAFFEGILKIAIFLGYMAAVSLMKDIKRVFSYHGAEHKTIFCYEAGLPLTVENVRPQSRNHPRCGTSFLFIVMIVSIIVFSVVSWSNPIIRLLLRLVLLPVVVSISYELIRWAGRHDNIVSKILSAPGKALQHLTVFEPDDDMIEVAIEAMKLVIPEEKGTDEW
jgi:uncharacterized protein YqhQ